MQFAVHQCVPEGKKWKGQNISVFAGGHGEKATMQKGAKTLLCHVFMPPDLHPFADTTRKGTMAQISHHTWLTIKFYLEL